MYSCSFSVSFKFMEIKLPPKNPLPSKLILKASRQMQKQTQQMVILSRLRASGKERLETRCALYSLGAQASHRALSTVLLLYPNVQKQSLLKAGLLLKDTGLVQDPRISTISTIPVSTSSLRGSALSSA